MLELDDPVDASMESGTVTRETIVPRYTDEVFLDEHEYEEELREKQPTLTDAETLEAARRRSIASYAPASSRGGPPPSARTYRPPMLGSWAPPSRGSGRPGSVSYESDAPDSQIELDAGEEDLDDLSEDEQEAILRARLAPLDRVPMLTAPLGEMGEFMQDADAAYVLGFVDSILPLETILEVAGLPVLSALRVFDRLVTLGLVTFRTPLHRR